MTITMAARRFGGADASQRTVSWLVFAWSVLYALPHLYWGLGGEAGLSTLKPTAPDVRGFQVGNTAAFFVIAALGFLGFALDWTRRRGVWRLPVLAAVVVASAMMLAHGVYGIVYRATMVTGVTDVDGAVFDAGEHGWVLWDMLVYEPWFVVEGVLLAMVGYVAFESRAGRRRWVATVSIVSLIALATAVLGVRVG